jgi:DNA-binding NarL/FixJ family response regulator
MAINIVIADDHPIFVEGLENVLRQEKDFKILARCGNGDEALFAVRKRRPDVLLLDYRMPGKDGRDVLRAIRTEQLPVRVVLQAALLEDHQVVEAVRLGVAGIFLMGMASQLLIQCIRAVHAGGRWLERGSTGRALDQLVRQNAAARGVNLVMSQREIEVVCLVSGGLCNQEIAKKLFITEGTVKVHLHNIYHKLSLNGRFALSRYARDRNLVNTILAHILPILGALIAS